MTLLHTRFRSILAAILIVGLGSALLIFLFAGIAPVDPLGDAGDSKMFVHDMLLYGALPDPVQGGDVLLLHILEPEQNENIARELAELFQGTQHIGERVLTE